MAYVKLGTAGLPATGLVVKSQHIHDSMVGLAQYPTPVPTQVAFQGAITALSLANAAAVNGGKAELQARRTAERALLTMYRLRAAYVQDESAGDADLIGLTGFEVRATGKPLGDLDRPANLVAGIAKVTGRVAARWKATRGADSYQVFLSTTNAPYNWVLVGNTTKARFNIDGLTRGQIVWIAATAVGAAGTTSLSEPLEAMAAA